MWGPQPPEHKRSIDERIAIVLVAIVLIIVVALLVLGDQDRPPGTGGRTLPERTR